MPDTIGIRELKNQTSRVIRTVREEMVEYVITFRGEPVAILRPMTPEESQQYRQLEMEESVRDMKSLAQDVADAWVSSKSGVELISEQRR